MSFWNPRKPTSAAKQEPRVRKIEVVTYLFEKKKVVYDVGYFETEFVDYYCNVHVIKEDCPNVPYVRSNLPLRDLFVVMDNRIVKVDGLGNLRDLFPKTFYVDEIVQNNVTITPPTQEWVLVGNELIKVKNYIKKTFVKTGEKEVELEIYAHRVEIV